MARSGPIAEADTERAKIWPPLTFQDWKDTYATLHMWTQIVGKIRMALTPSVNHWWHTPLYVASRGLTTSAMLPGSSGRAGAELGHWDRSALERS